MHELPSALEIGNVSAQLDEEAVGDERRGHGGREQRHAEAAACRFGNRIVASQRRAYAQLAARLLDQRLQHIARAGARLANDEAFAGELGERDDG
ncbi:MAG TPA: hypothetical protein VG591_01700 [Burkholderiales bacterium]|nr:hypothetical protein [Burkholderiales bacterium]